MWCYRHADVAEEIDYFIDVAKIRGLHQTQHERLTLK